MNWTPYECIAPLSAIVNERGPHVLYPRHERRKVCPICRESVRSGQSSVNLVGRKHHMECFEDFATYLKSQNVKLLLCDYAEILEEVGL